MPFQTETLFRDDAYLSEAEAKVVGINERGGIILDRSIFYATSGGQPGDTGHLARGDGRAAMSAGMLRPNSARCRGVKLWGAVSVVMTLCPRSRSCSGTQNRSAAPVPTLGSSRMTV